MTGVAMYVTLHPVVVDADSYNVNRVVNKDCFYFKVQKAGFS
jgi:hypothetical protein